MCDCSRGGAFFEVQPDAQRPFSVKAGDTRTMVLGTAFSVNMTDSGTIVSVAHGHVRVEDESISPAVSENLIAGDQLTVIWGKEVSQTYVSTEDVASWCKGELVVRSLPVSEVVDSFRRYYNGVILVTEPFASQRVTGLYRLNNPASTLADIVQAHGAKARQISPWVLLVSQ